MVNTVGSLTEEQKSILVGCLLGDGTMRKKKNAYLEINHCFFQKDLVDWLYSKFSDYVLTKPKWRKTNGKREAYRFSTQSLSVFTEYYDRFFLNKRKIIPKNFKLDCLSLAVWFMDDGCKNNSSIYLNTQHFSKEEQYQLIEMLWKNFGIESTLNKDKIYFRIRIRTKSAMKFIQLIDKFVLPKFKYKYPSVITP
ncbi:hypothetical protein COS55_01530 [Candidatus Shapirobacteria bacterium CG03_land_8_20_14_0_80_40_19]|uniref:Homing endonuclease LAGLIDADG domain-containing protein n=1 Tax=Candidatus Shapirobacteria bacterium CG03_land_8_20_14_0_80_40_19 TaxID=1974880 RepID=A0A2M7BEN7_9BACT|nr:MAG: hypothetical protein COS55_01530 [Candidatus Shapirobacteria bacterium CG03_land_8_20_14_0_80_40_19]